jgi:valyl-tRNA synthetase
MMQPQLAEKIAKQTRKEFPDGIPAFGTDALRFTFAALATTGRDIKFDLGRIEGYRNFCNKLWNASRYVLMNTEGEEDLRGCRRDDARHRARAPRTAGSQPLQETTAHGPRGHRRLPLRPRRPGHLRVHLEPVLRLVPGAVQAGADRRAARDAAKRGTRAPWCDVLETLLRLRTRSCPSSPRRSGSVAPRVGRDGPTIMLQPYPRAETSRIDNEANRAIAWLKDFVQAVRNVRGEMSVAPGRKLALLLRNGDSTDRRYSEELCAFLCQLAGLESLRWLAAEETPPAAATGLCGELEILVPLADLIDRDEELARLDREVAKLKDEIQRIEKKLANSQFVQKAPEAVVAKERDKCNAARQSMEKLLQQHRRVSEL